jgi:hypothetical protein
LSMAVTHWIIWYANPLIWIV